MTNTLFYIMMALSGFCAMGVLAAVMMSRAQRATSTRMMAIAQGYDKTDAKKLRAMGTQKLLTSVRALRSRLGMSEDPKLLERFAAAGLLGGSAVDIYLAARLLGPIAAIAAASFAPTHRPVFMSCGAGFSYLAPDIILTRLVKRRRERIRRSIPDAIDLLVICVDAGLGLDQAMLRVGQELGKAHPDLQQELLRINREQRAGKPRIEAWQSMAARNKLQELDAFVNMLMQTERFGTPIARALSNFGDGIRQKRRQRAEELAAKTTVKIIFPLVFCIFPTLFIVLLGPPGINIMHQMNGDKPVNTQDSGQTP